MANLRNDFSGNFHICVETNSGDLQVDLTFYHQIQRKSDPKKAKRTRKLPEGETTWTRND